MKKLLILGLVLIIVLAMPVGAAGPVNYGTVTLTSNGAVDSGHFNDVWDLTAGDITISFTYDGNGMVDDFGGSAHAWAELGVRSVGAGDFNPDTVATYGSGSKSVKLWTGPKRVSGEDDVGTLYVWNVGSTLYVRYELNSPECTILETHVAVASSIGGIPQKNGNPIPGQFPYQPRADGVYEIDLTPWAPGTRIYIAAHAKYVCCGGVEESAWAGATQFPGKNWAFCLYYDIPATTMSSGVWLATDYEWSAGTFNPDPIGAPTLDLDDKLILQRQGGQGEGAYNLPSTPPTPGNNHRVWWDRDGVDPWQNPATANTGGIYQIEIHLHATSATTGTAYMKIRGLWQGFETDGNWNTIELMPAGMTFTGLMDSLQVFYGLYGYGATHSATFSNITVTQ